jgi:Tol biopolymer transport system component
MDDREDATLIELAAAIADGRTVDWKVSRARHGRDASHITGLSLIAAIERLYAGAQVPSDPVAIDDKIDGASEPGRATDPLTWGPLAVIRKIGSGTFGDVYLAYERRLDREVALKLLRSRIAGGQDTVVVEEARLLAKIRHPNVTTVFGADTFDGRTGIWMEFIEGPTLEERVRRNGPFTAGEVLAVARQVASALVAVHAAGVVHRDVKAQNVIHAVTGHYVLTDFGTGLAVSDTLDEAQDLMAGSPLYLAPELFRGVRPSAASDIYAFGVLLYRLATADFPVHATSIRGLELAHASSRSPRWESFPPDFPVGLRGVIERACAPNPQQRHASAEALLADLARHEAPSGKAYAFGAVAAALSGIVIWAAVNVGAPRPAVGTGPESVIWQGVLAGSTLDVSPDGRLLAFVDEGGNLAVHDVASGHARTLTSSGSWKEGRAPQTAAFSPDGRTLVFSLAYLNDARAEVRRVSIATSEETVLPVRETFDWLLVHDVSADGRSIVVTLQDGEVRRLAIVDTTRGSAVIVRTLDWRGTTRAAFSPDGRYLAFDAVPTDTTAQRDVQIVSVDGRRQMTVVSGPSRDQVAGWSPDGRSLLVLSDRVTTWSLWNQPMLDGTPTGSLTLLKADVREEPVGISEDGHFFYLVATHDQTLRSVTIDPGTGKALGNTSDIVTTGLFNYRRPKWSPDGRFFATISSASMNEPTLINQRILSIQPDSGGAARAFWLPLVQLWTYNWSRDGRTILTRARNFRGELGIFQIDLATGDTSPLLLSKDQVFFSQPQWPVDRPGFYYVRGYEAFGVTRRDALVYRDPVLHQDRDLIRNSELVTADGRSAPAIRDWIVSPDGRQAAGISPEDDGYRVWTVVIGSRRVSEVFRAFDVTHNALLWTPDGRALIVNAKQTRNAKRELWRVPVNAGEQSIVIDIGDAPLVSDAPAISPDGRRLAFKAGSNPKTEIRSVKYSLDRR